MSKRLAFTPAAKQPTSKNEICHHDKTPACDQWANHMARASKDRSIFALSTPGAPRATGKK